MGGLDAVLQFGVYRLHPTQGLARDGTDVRLTRKALRVLWLLACRSGETVTKEELFRDAWPGVAVTDAALTSCIQELRRVLEDDASHPRFIETRHRQGFRFLPHTSAVLPARPAPSDRVSLGPGLCVGRERELAVLASALEAAGAGRRQLVVIRGEAGIGKTTLLRGFLTGLRGNATWVFAGATCAEATAGSEPYRPLLDSVSTLCRVAALDPGGELLRRYAPNWWRHFPVFQDPSQPSPGSAHPGTVTTTRMSRELTDYLEALATTHSLVLWIDDVQWADTVTVDWLASFIVRVEPARVLVLAALREGRPGPHDLLARLQTRSSCRAIALGGLDASAVREIVRQQCGESAAAAPLASRLHAQTEGHPLFISELLDEPDALVSLVPGVAAPSPIARDFRRRLPERLRGVIEAQITCLDPGEVELLEVASLSTSVEWPAALVAAGSDRTVLDAENALLQLARRRAFVERVGVSRWPDGTVSDAFAFRHALHREALHDRIPAHRRATVHGQIGVRLEQAFGPGANELATTLSRHFQEAGHTDKAVTYLRAAADAANRVGAAESAAGFLMRAVALLEPRPRSAEHDAREADIQVRLGVALMAARGWGAREVEQAYLRALELCDERANPRLRFAVYWGLWLFRWGRGELLEAQGLVERLQEFWATSPDRTLRLQVHHAQWATAFCLGKLEAAISHADEGWTLAGIDRGGDTMLAFGNHHAGVCARGFAARALALRGEGDAARTAADEAVARARDCSHPFTLALALVFAGATHQTRRDDAAARQFAEAAEAVSLEHGFELLLAWARALKGWAMRSGNTSYAVSLVRDGVSRAAGTGSGQFRTWLLALLAETLQAAGQVEDGMRAVDEALTYARTTGERFNEGELMRVRGALMATRTATDKRA